MLKLRLFWVTCDRIRYVDPKSHSKKKSRSSSKLSRFLCFMICEQSHHIREKPINQVICPYLVTIWSWSNPLCDLIVCHCISVHQYSVICCHCTSFSFAHKIISSPTWKAYIITPLATQSQQHDPLQQSWYPLSAYCSICPWGNHRPWLHENATLTQLPRQSQWQVEWRNCEWSGSRKLPTLVRLLKEAVLIVHWHAE
jgi:hypothetical protein